MARYPFHTLHTTTPAPASSSTSFTLSATAPTDIWKKAGPPLISTFNAPLIYKALPLSHFLRACVTVSGPWKTLYDQGGLVFILPSPKTSKPEDGHWIKTGIEFYNGAPYVSTVVKDRWADWSLVNEGIIEGGRGKQVTIEMERNEKEGTLWIYVIAGEKKIPIREVTWILSEEEQEIWVGVYAAKPTEGEDKELVVGFEGWELDIAQS